MENDFTEIAEELGESDENNCYGEISGLLSCDFETDSRCGWTLSGFRKWQGETYTPQTGPKNAHSGTNYVYLESSENKVAKLESFHIAAGTSLCLQFRYELTNFEIQRFYRVVRKFYWGNAKTKIKKRRKPRSKLQPFNLQKLSHEWY